ncbi:laminin G (plasmid) [Salinigranum rubrum]|uniref:dolichyl-phosphooligosaccharide-protein glycotransferase n=1 Tax=Salinigranum rubrum TaxID=755307 RepID=A0A2I8VQF4_9EURY|nr:STT3 domain-containing protein [Salinigranum rubrum]AUV84148.1 laminin G [Salinigranum rubrum]
MSDVDTAVATLLEEKPHLKSDLREILAVDAAHETWSFDDVPVDSGAFGEMVSRGIVAKRDGEYEVADPEAVRRRLDGETSASPVSNSETSLVLSLPSLSSRWGGALAVVIILAALFRGYTAPSVFRGEHIVFLGNDPYFYRHWIRQLALAEAGPLAVPTGIQAGEPLFIAAVWTITAVLGGSATTGYTVLALYPLVSGLLTIPLAYEITRRVTGERRIALAAALLLAITPVHVFRTALGFADHHAFDYLWLALTLLSGVALTRRNPRERSVVSATTLFWMGVFAVGVAAQTLAWNAGPLLLLPIALFSLAAVTTARAHDFSPVPVLTPITVGLGLASVLVWAGHLILGWQPLQVVLTPTLLFIGVGVVFLVGVVATRYSFSPRVTAGGVLFGGVTVLAVTLVTLPEFAAEFSSELARLVGLTYTEGIAETISIFSPQYGTFFGPALFFGFVLFFALPYVPWSLYTGYRTESLALLLIGTYASVFAVLAVIQVRFAGELSIVLAPFAGLALVHLGSIVDAVPRPTILDASTSVDSRPPSAVTDPLTIPDRQTIGILVVVFLLIGGFGMIQGPVQTNKSVYSDEAYRTATWVENHATQSGSSLSSVYVFSDWGQNRMYNAFVSGNSESYGFAQSIYPQFVSATQPDSWYDRLGGRVDYIVMTSVPSQGEDGYQQTTHAILYESLGSATLERGGAGHYQAVYRSNDRSHVVFRPVEGAVINGTAEPGSTVTISTEVSIPNAEFTYTRRTHVTENGTFRVIVPYAGTYTIGIRKCQLPLMTLNLEPSYKRGKRFRCNSADCSEE